MRPDTLGVLGLGAVGGSVAWGAVLRGVPSVLGFTRSTADGVAAVNAGAVTELAHDPRQVVRRSDLVVLAAPPGATLELLRHLRDDIKASGVLVTDVTSIKEPVVRLAEDLGLDRAFAGSHPLAGTHRSGFGAARADLLTGAVVYVTPAGPDGRPGREVADFWSGTMGATPIVMAAAAHDDLLAWTSHLPQVVASALAAALARRAASGLALGSGALDTTRLAAGSSEMWRDVLLMNRRAVLGALEGFDDAIGKLRQALRGGNEPELTEWLEQGAEWRRSFDS